MPERFRKSVQTIMRGSDMPATVPEHAPDRPDSFGWLRRPDLDRLAGEAWEMPDGSIRVTTPRRVSDRTEPSPR